MTKVEQLFSLKDKTALITGASSGIGYAVAETFCQLGARVVIADIVDGHEAARQLGAHFVPMDVSDEGAVAAGFAQACKLLGCQLDAVVLNAGVGDVGPTFEQTSAALVEKVTQINHWGVLYGLKHAPSALKDGGTITATASMAAFINLPGSGVYSAGKRAITSMTEMAALELGSRGIRVNAVCPGYTDTALGSGDEGEALCNAFTALGRVATVDDMAGVYAFLAADASGYITGQSLKVDGGWSCGPTTKLLELVTGSAAAPS